MLDRVLEPEVMDEPAEAVLYDAMDHRGVNHQFLSDFISDFPEINRQSYRILDCGTGTAQIPILFCKELPDLLIVACDAADSMLAIAEKNIVAAGLQPRVLCHRQNVTGLSYPNCSFDGLISNSLIHHLHQPHLAISEMVRVVRPGGPLFIRDLLRPESNAQIEYLVKLHAGSEPAESQQLLRQSLAAALDLLEIRQLVSRIGYPPGTVMATSDRHWTWSAVRRE
jgi:ubiquinone/menaquinone biosynthesis C-methylase UbiE